MVRGLFSVRNKEADAFISCGCTGALLVGGQTIVGRIRGIQRGALAFVMPSLKGPVLMIDCGANADARPEMLLQFAQMGSIYMEHIVGVKNPKVGIVNIGEEEEKGNLLVKETFPLLKACDSINFVGSVESRGIPEGEVDVVVCDAFVGNVILKMYEGVSTALIHKIKDVLMSSTKTKIGALLIKSDLKNMLNAGQKGISQEHDARRGGMSCGRGAQGGRGTRRGGRCADAGPEKPGGQASRKFQRSGDQKRDPAVRGLCGCRYCWQDRGKYNGPESRGRTGKSAERGKTGGTCRIVRTSKTGGIRWSLKNYSRSLQKS